MILYSTLFGVYSSRCHVRHCSCFRLSRPALSEVLVSRRRVLAARAGERANWVRRLVVGRAIIVVLAELRRVRRRTHAAELVLTELGHRVVLGNVVLPPRRQVSQ